MSALIAGYALPPEIFLVLISVRGRIRYSELNSMIPSGAELVTFLLVALPIGLYGVLRWYLLWKD
jgi:hypothetical protein